MTAAPLDGFESAKGWKSETAGSMAVLIATSQFQGQPTQG